MGCVFAGHSSDWNGLKGTGVVVRTQEDTSEDSGGGGAGTRALESAAG